VSVNYTTVPGLTKPATEGTDYTDSTGSLTFLPGETSKTVTVIVTGDKKIEKAETFVVQLSNQQDAQLPDTEGLGKIKNDDR
jgi:hypothetical protein